MPQFSGPNVSKQTPVIYRDPPSSVSFAAHFSVKYLQFLRAVTLFTKA